MLFAVVEVLAAVVDVVELLEHAARSDAAVIKTAAARIPVEVDRRIGRPGSEPWLLWLLLVTPPTVMFVLLHCLEGRDSRLAKQGLRVRIPPGGWTRISAWTAARMVLQRVRTSTDIDDRVPGEGIVEFGGSSS
jgi:hypothetical protein